MHLFGMEDYCENIRIKIKESLEIGGPRGNKTMLLRDFCYLRKTRFSYSESGSS